MTNQAFVGKVYLERGDGASPESYERICQAINMTGIGQENELVEITTFCSGGAKEYTGGLADGKEITLTLNLETAPLLHGGVIGQMINDVKNRVTRDFRLIIDDEIAGNTSVAVYFAAACISWELVPSISDKNTIAFGCKISGNLDLVDGG